MGVAAEHFLETICVAIDTDRGCLAQTQINDVHASVCERLPIKRLAKFVPFDDSRRPRSASHGKCFYLKGHTGQDAPQALIPLFARGMRPACAAKRGDAIKTVVALGPSGTSI
jgi:hypothetical protein